MKTKYGESVLKDRGYNSPSTSAIKSAATLAGLTLTYSVTIIADIANVARQADATIRVAQLSTEASRVTAEATVEAARMTLEARH